MYCNQTPDQTNNTVRKNWVSSFLADMAIKHLVRRDSIVHHIGKLRKINLYCFAVIEAKDDVERQMSLQRQTIRCKVSSDLSCYYLRGLGVEFAP